MMASLALVDFAITGIFIAITGRSEVALQDLIANLTILGLINAAGAWALFRPIDRYLRGGGDIARAQARVIALPRLATLWALFVTLIYCAVIFYLGVFLPSSEALDQIPQNILILSVAWFGFVYLAYYGFYIYFAANDFTDALKLKLFSRGVTFVPSSGRVVNKLIIVFAVLALIPNALVILDLTVFRDLRAAQGLSVRQSIFLDLFASVFLICVSLVFVTRSLIRPMNALMTSMDALKEGRLDTRAPVTSSDELGVLSERFNEMIVGLNEREFIRETFGQYVPRKVASVLLANRGVLKPSLVEATILYADLENFTRICEEHAPDAVLQILNEYFAAVTEAIKRTGGIVNQFHGDAILVTYNVPVADPHHADNAIAAALAIQSMVLEKTFAGMKLRVRIGISTGQVVAGAVGGGDRLSYTVYGDAVNLAARLEALNKEVGSLVLVSDTTVARARNAFPLQPIGEVTVRGKQKPASVYTLNV